MHDKLPKIFCFINNYKENYIKRLPKNIAIIYRNYNKILNKMKLVNTYGFSSVSLFRQNIKYIRF